jgi:putative addiction module component (TIGR02574 family)
MSVLEIEEKVMSLSNEEKLGLVARIWESMEQAPNDEPPEWHGDVLVERLKRIESGEAKTYSWEEVKERMATRSREAGNS